MVNKPAPPRSRGDAASPPLINLDQRSRDIFRKIVDTYLETGSPVGSRNLSRLLPMSLSPASVRNVMADLEEQGLIHARHVSAGRMPTETGLRFFVDSMLEIGDLSADEQRDIEARIHVDASDQTNIQSLLAEASEALSGLSQGAGVVLAGKVDIRLKHLEFIRLEPTRALVVLVGEDGSVENRLIEIDPGTTPSSLTEAANFMNAHLRGRSLSEARQDLEASAVTIRAELDKLTGQIIESGLASWADAREGQPETLIVRGQANLLADLDVAADLERVRLLFQDLETQKSLVDLLASAETGDGVRIFIGSENQLFSLSGSSLVVSPYRDSNQRVVGVLGVIGPTRLNYARIVPVVDYTAQLIGRLIS